MNAKKNGIPPEYRDLIAYVRRRDAKRLLLCALWIAGWIGGAVLYNLNHQTYPAYRRIVGWKLAIVIVASAVTGFLFFRLYAVFFDRTYGGIIHRSGLSHSYTPSPDPGAGASDYDFRLNTALRIRTESGKLRRLRFEQKNGFYRYYREGRQVVHLHGLPYPVATDQSPDTGFLCTACGRIMSEHATHCEDCGLSLIDSARLSDIKK